MAGSISIVLAQSPRRDPNRQGMEEQLVTALLMEDRQEVNVVPDLTLVEGDDSAQLCLEGLTAHVVLLCWHPPDLAFAELGRLGVPGRFGRTRQTPEIPQAFRDLRHPRAIYCLDLAQFDSSLACREEIRRIAQEQAVQVFTIGGAAHAGQATGKPERRTESRVTPQPPPLAQPSQPVPPPEPVDWDDDQQLESLVDELDGLDL